MRRCTGPVRKTRRWCNKCITVHVIWWYSWFLFFHEVINKGWNNWTKEHPNSYISKYFFDFFLSPKIQRESFFWKIRIFFSVFIYWTNFLRPSVDIDFGRSSGRPTARDQIIWEKQPKARETPNKTV